MLESCLQSAGTQVHKECVQTCGDYEGLNDQLHLDTSTLKPEDQAAVESLSAQTNRACSVLKCSARCAVDKFNQQCGQLSNGMLAGNLIRETVERILATHRMDLQVFNLMETMKKTTQPECSYLHTADVLFNPVKDMIAQQVITQEQKRIAEQPVVVVEKGRLFQFKAITNTSFLVDPEQQIKLTANQLYVKILKKQLQVLDKQLQIMDKQKQKMGINELPRFMQNPPTRQFEGEMF